MLKQKYIDARNTIKCTVRVAKSRQMIALADRISNTSKTPKDAWKVIRIIKKGFSEHHTDYITMKFQKEDGSLTTY